MKVVPIAFDSLGTRSMCTFVQTKDVNIVIDPGVALGPLRYGLSPHPLELQRREAHEAEIRRCCENSTVLTISHYHYDHYIPGDPTPYHDKILLVKHPKEHINRSQLQRASEFLNVLEEVPQKIEYADEQEFTFGSTRIKFSSPCWHGAAGSKLGYVVMVSIDDGETKLMHCSDVQGPVVAQTAQLIIKENPDFLIMGGPLSYMVGFRLSWQNLRKAEDNFIQILRKSKTRTLILDHHLLRDLRFKQKFANAYAEAKRLGKEVLTAAEFLGKPVEMLEARRKELYSG